MPEKDLKLLGNRIKHLRKNAGFTQEQMAEKAFMHPKYIGQLERGEINTTVETILRLSRALGIPIREFFNLPGKNQHKKVVILEISDALHNQSLQRLELIKRIVKELCE
jgi:transcriptional regulator with XRE-family HTH domain